MKKELTKCDVYVLVDTPKKAKKLKKVLDMFGEDIYHFAKTRLNNEEVSITYPVIHFYNSANSWAGYGRNTVSGKSEVSIKELRNILAVEHLKERDVVVVKNKSSKWILKITGNNIDKFEHTLSLDLKDNYFSDNKWTITNGNFIRYATEAEKELLRVNSLKEQAKEVIKPVSYELVVGKWYVINGGYEEALIFNVDNETGYGFGWYDGWTDKFRIDNVVRFEQTFRPATPQEVEKSLIEEAKRMGVEGNKNLKIDTSKIYNHGGIYDVITKDQCFRYSNNLLEVLTKSGAYTVFKEGKWATIIEQPIDKFAELKEAHKNGSSH